MASYYNCTQFTEPYPEPDESGALNSTVPWIIDTLVTAYRPTHIYILTFLLVFAFFANILIVIVLWQKEMRSIGVNVTMIFIALCDFGCSVSALGQLLLRNYSDTYTTYFNAYSQLICDYLAVAFHASSLYLAAGMAFCRVMSLNMRTRNRDNWQSPRYAVWVALVLCVPVFILAVVVLFVNEVKFDEEDGVYIDISDFSIQYHCMFLKVSLCLAGSCFKMLPCLAMLLLSLFLLRRIDDSRKSMAIASQDNSNKVDRSSRFIQFVLIVFLITESPQGAFSILGGLCINDYINYYQNLSIFMNVLAFFNTTTSFIIYSALSSKFRKLFAHIFLPNAISTKIYPKRSIVVVQSTVTLNSRTA